MIIEVLPERHEWLRISEAKWRDPLDPGFAAIGGGRWNPPASWPTLYLNEDVVTARLNLRLFIAFWPYEPEDLRDDTGPVLAVATLPHRQSVADAHTPAGVAALDLPATYPLDGRARLVPHGPCQAAGRRVLEAGVRGVRCRSARAPDGAGREVAGREVAWFPATKRSRATLVRRLRFDAWFWG